jgi:hypothetical protein
MWMKCRQSAACLTAILAVAATPLLQAGQQRPPVFRSHTRLIEVSRSLEKRMDISVSAEHLSQFLREGLSVDHRFTLVPSAERLRVIIRDVRTGHRGHRREPATIAGDRALMRLSPS